MQRLSRAARIARWTLPLTFTLYLAFEVACVYLFILDRRLVREVRGHSWRSPTVIYSNAGKTPREIAKVYGTDWRVTPPVLMETLPKHVADAFVAAEDVRFRRHLGIDPIGMLRALLKNVRAGGIAQGGSTIPQQVVKQHFLTNERTWKRKLIEIALAVDLDVRLTKDEILELYLNDVYLGHHNGIPTLGIDEASRLYFDKPPRQLRVDEAALLAAMIRAPNRDTPEKRPDIALARRNAILAVMRDRGWISREEFDRAAKREVDVQRGALPETPYPYYLRALRIELANQVSKRGVAGGGLTILCEMDPRAQRAAERAARESASRLESRFRWIRDQARKDPLQVAILSIDPENGGVRALVGGADFNRSPFDRTSQMRRQPGSAFKTFAYLAAINSKKATNSTLLLDAPVKIQLAKNETWQPQNYDQSFRGRVTLREAFERSLNVPTVRLTQQVGLKRVKSTAEEFGFTNVESIPAMPLGVFGVTMRELTAAYTVFPNLGQRVEPFLLTSVKDRHGKVLFEREIKKKIVAEASSVYVMHTLLRGVVRRGTATRLKRYGLGQVAGKTGTTNDYRDAWFVGYTKDMVTSVWVGFDRGAPLRLSSSEAALPVWGAYMSQIPHDPANPEPPGGVTFRDIDPESGMLWREGCPGPIREVYLDGTAPTRHCPSGMFGRIVRRVLFDEDHFDEPAAITFDQFRRWANDVDRNRQDVEGFIDRLERFFKKD